MNHQVNDVDGRPAAPAGSGWGRRVALGLVALYQARRADRPSPCRFYPTCSAYAAEAIERYGAWTGTRLAIRRVLRCRPFGPHGIDLVPLKTSGRS